MPIHIHKVGTELWFLATDIVKALEKYCNLNFDSYVSNVQQLTKWVPPEYKRTERFMAPLGTIKRVLLNRVGVGVALNTVCVDEARKMYEWCKNVVYPSQGIEAPRDDAILAGMAEYQRKNGWRLPPNTAEIEPDHLVEAPEEPGKNEGAELQMGDDNASIPRVFENPQFGSVRTIIKDGEPWFVASDVCKALEIKNGRDAMSRLDDDEKMTVGLTDVSSNGVAQRRDFSVVNEPGLYSLVLNSRKPEAKAFKRWITHEVTPSIRKTGGYIAGQDDMSDAELLSRAILVAQRQIEQRNSHIRVLLLQKWTRKSMKT